MMRRTIGARGPIVALSLTVGMAVAPVAAQSPAAGSARPAFEVASIKLNKSGEQGMSLMTRPGGRFVATNITLRLLVLNAYDLQESQLVGLPDWADSERFDITAKAEQDIPAGPGANTVDLMLQSLLADRFKFAAHTERRELPVYALLVARTDEKLGPQMKASAVDCAARVAARSAGGPPIPPPQPGERPTCGVRMSRGTLTGGGVTMANLATMLSSRVQRMVIDRTGLGGGFDIDFTWTPEQSADTSGPSVFTALQEQLGLRLEPQRHPLDVLVVDHVARPTPD